MHGKIILQSLFATAALCVCGNAMAKNTDNLAAETSEPINTGILTPLLEGEEKVIANPECDSVSEERNNTTPNGTDCNTEINVSEGEKTGGNVNPNEYEVSKARANRDAPSSTEMHSPPGDKHPTSNTL